MAGRRERYNRDWLLIQFKNDPEAILTLSGYLNINPKTNWYSFTQVENESGLRISGHINLPKHKVLKLFPEIESFNHKPFIIKGKPSFYDYKGTKRGSLLLTELSKKV